MRAHYPHTDGYAPNPTDGVRIFYEVFGPPDASRTIVFLPTWTMVHSAVWQAQVPYFSRQGFRVVTFDNRGNGRSDRPATGYSVDRITEDALTVMEATGVQRAALVAVSAGARWAVKLAVEHPERATHLALIDPSCGSARRLHIWSTSGMSWTTTRGSRSTTPRTGDETTRTSSTSGPSAHFPEPHSLKHIEDSVRWGLETTAEVLIQTVVEGELPDAADLLGRIQCPTLLVRGSEDGRAALSQDAAEALQRAITGSELVVLEGCGHAPTGLDPVRTNLLLYEFLGPARSPLQRSWRHASTRKQICSPVRSAWDAHGATWRWLMHCAVLSRTCGSIGSRNR